METLFLIVVGCGLLFAVWKVSKAFTKKVKPTVSSGGIRPTEPVDPTKPTTNTEL